MTLSPAAQRYMDEYKAKGDYRSAPKVKTSADIDFDRMHQHLEEMTPYIDECTPPSRSKIKPSFIMKIQFCMIASHPTEGAFDRARSQYNAWVAESRRRYRAGYCANPLGEPVLRGVGG